MKTIVALVALISLAVGCSQPDYWATSEARYYDELLPTSEARFYNELLPTEQARYHNELLPTARADWESLQGSYLTPADAALVAPADIDVSLSDALTAQWILRIDEWNLDPEDERTARVLIATSVAIDVALAVHEINTGQRCLVSIPPPNAWTAGTLEHANPRCEELDDASWDAEDAIWALEPPTPVPVAATPEREKHAIETAVARSFTHQQENDLATVITEVESTKLAELGVSGADLDAMINVVETAIAVGATVRALESEGHDCRGLSASATGLSEECYDQRLILDDTNHISRPILATAYAR